MYKSSYISPIGDIILTSDGINLTGLWFSDQKYIGHAVSKNPIAIIVSCHRVIGKNGKLVGYEDRKEELLKIEGIGI